MCFSCMLFIVLGLAISHSFVRGVEGLKVAYALQPYDLVVITDKKSEYWVVFSNPPTCELLAAKVTDPDPRMMRLLQAI
jgi:hypothetical protein